MLVNKIMNMARNSNAMRQKDNENEITIVEAKVNQKKRRKEVFPAFVLHNGLLACKFRFLELSDPADRIHAPQSLPL